MSGAPSCVVVVPVYRAVLDDAEARSLRQLQRVLGRWRCMFVAPASLAMLPLLQLAPGFGVERFDDAYFAGIVGYNRLVLSAEFYRRFAAHDYLLIHQLDAWVFRDELADWCARGHDYVGAPWIRPELLHRPAPLNWRWWRGQLARRLLDGGSRLRRHAQYGQVGNGGFSLRRVRACLRLVDSSGPRLASFLAPRSQYFHEDSFFGLDGPRADPPLRVPGWREALDFSIESWPREAMAWRRGRLPFGCHGWPKVDPEFWRGIIPRD